LRSRYWSLVKVVRRSRRSWTYGGTSPKRWMLFQNAGIN
jgi:hypothetical protein